MKNYFDTADIKENKALACVGYIGILFLIPLLFKSKSDFALYHGKQGMVLFIAEVVASFINVIPLLGQLVWLGLTVIFVVFSIKGILSAWKGEAWEMPYLGKYARRINIDV